MTHRSSVLTMVLTSIPWAVGSTQCSHVDNIVVYCIVINNFYGVGLCCKIIINFVQKLIELIIVIVIFLISNK